MVALDAPRLAGDRDAQARLTMLALSGALVLTALLSLSHGASGVSLGSLVQALTSGEAMPARDRLILWEIRLPRMLTGVLVGASLAVAGAVMQGLFRNPLADPGLVGVGAGAGLGAVLAIVLGGLAPLWLTQAVGYHLVSVAAFLGGWASTLILYRVATRSGRTSVATMLLAGIALGALAGAVTGVLVYIADDRQLRDLTFWGLGSLGGASWPKLMAAGPVMLLALVAAPFLARGLNGLALGEAAAHHIGLPVQRVKAVAILTVAAATGAGVAIAGGIGFIGIVVPHLLRLATGPDHRFLLINAGLAGATLLLLADLIARSIIAPAELPIGIVTATLGAPVFLWILLRRRGLVDL
ncbi:iron ABC transporter permease [Pseudotabrizicola sp. 4114]|uniref:FecCD family ABC transporter permease n=1 Tax=Pseudotabrizicola sp. 4114 TaxID=2817731 RepID=UPI002861AE41|nr:iron complex transport system permease protein [Pseudorhodobacter sp. 4114]